VLTQVVNFSSPLTTTAGTLNLDSVSDSGLFIAFEGTSNATPEPGSFALFGGGAAFLGFRRVRKTARMVKKLMPPGHSNSIIRQGVACGRCVDPQVASGSALQTGTGFLCPDVGAPNDNARPTRRRPA